MKLIRDSAPAAIRDSVWWVVKDFPKIGRIHTGLLLDSVPADAANKFVGGLTGKGAKWYLSAIKPNAHDKLNAARLIVNAVNKIGGNNAIKLMESVGNQGDAVRYILTVDAEEAKKTIRKLNPKELKSAVLKKTSMQLD